ncbi:Phage capsid family [Vibrio coralliirubri]|uniref:major capsid protein n=1 Tax=Vibrio coralliirubri TaxID=1516159 RepID=UPI0006312C43|nr:hypothetical protein [Vibrio coralliirubri]CDT52701.1 Phage capsid family [Vibrio coralliirubri]
MPLLKSVAEEISNNHLIAGVIEEIITDEALYALLPFTQVNGKAYVYNRETKLADSQFLEVNAEIQEEASEFKSVTTHLKILIGDVDVDKFIDATMSDTDNQKAIQLAMKAKGMGRRFKDALINGGNVRKSPNDPNGPDLKVGSEFDGIRKIWTDGVSDTDWKDHWADQVISIDSSNAPTDADSAIKTGSLTFEKLDELLDTIPGDADFLMMRKDTYRTYKSLVRTSSGGLVPDYVLVKDFGRVPSYDGTPIIINDYLPTLTGDTSKKFTEVYAIRTNEVDGLHGLFGGSNAGIVVEDIGTVQNKDATRTRMKWYCGLALKSTRSLAVLRGIESK